MIGEKDRFFCITRLSVDDLRERNDAGHLFGQIPRLTLGVFGAGDLVNSTGHEAAFRADFKYLNEKHLFVGHLYAPVT